VLLFSVLLIGRETWDLTLTEEDKVRVLCTGLLGTISGLRRMKMKEAVGNYTIKSFMIDNPRRILPEL
jgi:hypothetical protein